ncbi:hypothetical protein LSCM1_03578 [Leishmania martiniquensis]|uniref:Uncharacterized protein n=1 Tax=Leishmania martiniquensis TaxID=1580590 RepID=A0A836H5H3_9TRYP|nr:hypothetical protein LSCM1_03578 [Leishmania martiniquensis]
MTSLMPFDFRCLQHLVGVSLRCAPLHVRLAVPQPWSAASTARHGTAMPTNAPGEGGHDSPLCLLASSEKSGEDGSCQKLSTQVRRETAAAAASGSPSSPAHTASADDAGYLSLPLPPSPGHNITPLGEEAAHASTAANADITSSVRTAKFHSPSLCIEVYYTIDVFPPFSSSAAPVGQTLSAAPAQAKRDTEDSRVHGDRDDESAVQEQRPPTLVTSPISLYTSEVARGSSHPCWAAIPPGLLGGYGAATQVELAFYYTAACLSKAVSSVMSASDPTPSTTAPLHRIVPTDVCVHRCRVDMRDVVYAGSTVEEADATLSRVLHIEQQQQPQTRCSTKPIIFLRYTDGVFVPRVCLSDVSAAATVMLEEMQAARTSTFAPPPTVADLQVMSFLPSTLHRIGSQTSTAAACEELPWSRAPSSVGWRYPPNAVPRAGPLRLTMGDLKAAALATVAWQRLADVMEARQANLAADLNCEAAADPEERAQEALCAELRVQLSAARERLALSTLELEGLREQVEQRRRQLRRQEEAHAQAQRHQAYIASSEAREQSRAMAREEEARRARLRAQLARSRQQRARELCLVYTVDLSSQYANEACTRAADAKDHINKCALPIMFAGRADADTASHLVASTAEDMHEEAVALGHAGHLLVALSILYSCALPCPILLGSGQSHVLPSPNISAQQVLAAPYTLTDALKYPLRCHKVAERPLMMAGVHLLLRDGIALAKAMGKPERRVLACSDRLGALLDLLLHDVE